MTGIRRLLPWLLLLAGVVPALSLFLQFPDLPHFGNFHDDTVYVQSGMAIATGQGYRLIHLPQKPFQTKYPPLYSLWIALVWKIWPVFPENLSLVIALNFAALAGLLFSLWRWNQLLGFPPWGAAVLASGVACLPVFVYLTASVMTEVLFLALFASAILLLEKSLETGVRTCALAGLLASLACLTRSAGMPILLTAPACLLLLRRWRHAAAFLVGALPFVASWQAWVWQHAAPADDWITRYYISYGQMERLTVGVDNAGLVVYQNLDSMLNSFAEMFLFGSVDSSGLWHHTVRLVGIAAIAGSIRLAWQTRRWQYPAYALVFATLMLFWHCPPDLRLFAHLAPLLVLGLWFECRHIWRLARCRKGMTGMLAAGSVLAFGAYLGCSIVHARLVALPALERLARVEMAARRTGYAAIRQITPANATLLSDQDVLLSLNTHRSAYRTIHSPRLFYPIQKDRIRAAFAALPDSSIRPWDYVLVGRFDWRHELDAENREKLRREIESRSDLELVWRGDVGSLYRRSALHAFGRKTSGVNLYSPAAP